MKARIRFLRVLALHLGGKRFAQTCQSVARELVVDWSRQDRARATTYFLNLVEGFYPPSGLTPPQEEELLLQVCNWYAASAYKAGRLTRSTVGQLARQVRDEGHSFNFNDGADVVRRLLCAAVSEEFQPQQ